MPGAEAWKTSVFNIEARARDRVLLFNSVTSAILALSEPQAREVELCLGEIATTGTTDRQELLQGLATLGYVVPRAQDEYGGEHARFLATRAAHDALFLTIVPTLACNLRCTYCFQQEIPRGRAMTRAVQDGLVEFVRRKLDGCASLIVQWFGGEPLLRWTAIRELSGTFLGLCRERGAAYRAELLTNGLLLNPRIIEEIGEAGVRAIQIPLDGKPETYARRKQVTVGRAQAYYDFLASHLDRLAQVTGSVTIRINVDRENGGEAEAVVSWFRQRGVVDPRIDFRLGFLNTSRGVLDCIPHDCYSYGEFADAELGFRRTLSERGFRVYGYPGRRDYPCTAALWNSYTVDAQGSIGKCVPSIGTSETVFARIYPDDMERTLEETRRPGPYADFDPFEAPACRDCPLLPVCLGSCPKMHAPGRRPVCALKEDLGEMLAFYHDYDLGRVDAAS